MATITLKEIAEKLVEGDDKIVEKQEVANTKLTSIDKGIQKFLKAQANRKLDDLEDERERKKKSSAIAAAVGAGAIGKSAAAGGGFSLPSMSDMLKKGLIVGVLGAAGVAAIRVALAAAGATLKGLQASANTLKNSFDDRAKTARGLQRFEAEELKAKEAAKANRLKAEADAAKTAAKLKEQEASKLKRQEVEAKKEIERLQRKSQTVEVEKKLAADEAAKKAKAAEAEALRLKEIEKEKRIESEKAKRLSQRATEIKKLQNAQEQKKALEFLKKDSIETDLKNRPRYPAGTVIDGKKVGGQFMSDTAIQKMTPTSKAADLADAAKAIGKDTLRVVGRGAAIAAPIIAAKDALEGAGSAAELARAEGREATRGEVAGRAVGSVVGGIAGIVDIVPAAINFLSNKIAGKSIVTQTKIGETVTNAVADGITKGYAKQGIGLTQIEKETADKLIKAKNAKFTSSYDGMADPDQQLIFGAQQRPRLSDVERNKANVGSNNGNGAVVAAPQTNITDNSRKTTVINQTESGPSTIDNWSGFSVMP